MRRGNGVVSITAAIQDISEGDAKRGADAEPHAFAIECQGADRQYRLHPKSDRKPRENQKRRPSRRQEKHREQPQRDFGAHDEEEAGEEEARREPDLSDNEIECDRRDEQEQFQPRIPMMPAVTDAGILVILDHAIEAVGVALTAHPPCLSATMLRPSRVSEGHTGGSAAFLLPPH